MDQRQANYGHQVVSTTIFSAVASFLARNDLHKFDLFFIVDGSACLNEELSRFISFSWRSSSDRSLEIFMH